MFIIIVFLFLFSIFLIKNRISDRISRFVAYSFAIYWFLSLAISTFEPMGFFEVSSKAYAILLLGVMSFIVGLCIPKSRKPNNLIINKSHILIPIEKILLNKKIVFIIFILSLYFLSHAQEALITSAIEGKSMRVTTDSELYIGNRTFKMIYLFIGFPLFNFLMTIIPYVLFNYKREYIVPSIFSVIFIVSFIIINSGRVMFIIMLLYIIIMYVIYKNGKIKLSFKTTLLSILFLFVAIMGISSITNFRNYGSFEMDNELLTENINDTKERLLSYSVLPIVLFDRSLEEDYMTKFKGPQWGKATFAGIELYIGNAYKRLNYNYKTGNDIVISYIQNNFVPISPYNDANFAYTGIFFHYQDFGLVGVIILPLIFGFVFRQIIIDFYVKHNLALLALIGFLYFMMMYSIFCCYLIKPWVTFYIPVLLYFGYKHKFKYNIQYK